VNSPDVLEALKGVNDSELGVNIVDLGLVYRAEHGPVRNRGRADIEYAVLSIGRNDRRRGARSAAK